MTTLTETPSSQFEDFARAQAPRLAALWREQLGGAEADGCELTPELLEITGRLALLKLGLPLFSPRLQQLALETMALRDSRLDRFAYGDPVPPRRGRRAA